MMTMDTLGLDALSVLAGCAWVVHIIQRFIEARASIDEAYLACTGSELAPSGGRRTVDPLRLGDLGSVRTEGTEHGEANDDVEKPEVHQGSDEQTSDQRSIHDRRLSL